LHAWRHEQAIFLRHSCILCRFACLKCPSFFVVEDWKCFVSKQAVLLG
jgi:hypothetical protein